jgi:hypothetical protein
MVGVVPSPRRITRTGSLVAVTLAAAACLPLSDLDSAAAGNPAGSETGGVLAPTGGDAGTRDTGGTGASAPSSGGTESGGTGGIASGGTGSASAGGTGGAEPNGGTAGVELTGATGGVEPNGGFGGVKSNGGSAGGEPTGGTGGGEPTGGTGGGEPTGGDGGIAGATGGDSGTGGTGGLACVGDWQDCDTNPLDCETDITSDPAHCGACGEACLGTYDDCIDSECVTPCNETTALVMAEQNRDYSVRGNGCVQVVEHLAGSYRFIASVATPFTYVAEECNSSGEGVIPIGTGSEPIPACPMVLDLKGTSAQITISWWNGG